MAMRLGHCTYIANTLALPGWSIISQQNVALTIMTTRQHGQHSALPHDETAAVEPEAGKARRSATLFSHMAPA